MQETQEYPRIDLQDFKKFRHRAENLYHIRTKANELITFQMTQAQRIIDDIVEEEYERTKKQFGVKRCKLIILKPRQIGATTYSAMRGIDMQSTIPMCSGLVVAHNNETSDVVYDMFKRAHEYMPEYFIPKQDEEPVRDEEGKPVHIEVKPETKSFSGKRLEYARNDSRLLVQTAGAGDNIGKGITLNYLLASEAANWPDFDLSLTSINQALPQQAQVFCVIESTANGVSGIGEGFYKLWLKSQKAWQDYKSGKTRTFEGFRPVFVPWYLIEEYTRPLAGGKLVDIDEIDFGSADGKQQFLEKEQKLRDGIINPLNGEEIKVSEEHINWYRWCLKENCNYNYNTAKRYYPTFPEEAFVASNNCYFNTEELSEVKGYYNYEKKKEYKQGDVTWNESSDVVFDENPAGYFKMWYEPEDGWEYRYILSIDPSRGHEDGDYGVIKVLDRLKQRWCGRWYGKVDEDILAEEATKIGIYYNEALIIPESNLGTVVNILKPDGIHPYVGDMYWEESGRDLKYGFYMTGSSRKLVLDKYLAWLRDDYFKIPDLAEVDEHLSFVRKESKRGSRDNVKYEADEGCHDDIVIANSLAVFADEWYDRSPKQRKFQKLTDIIRKPRRKSHRKRWKQSQLGRTHSYNVN